MFYIKVVEEIKTRILVRKRSSENRVAYEIMRKNMVQADRPQMKTQHGAENIQFARWIRKARIHTQTHNV